MQIALWLLAAFALIATILHIGSIAVVSLRATRTNDTGRNDADPLHVTILRPVRGMENNLGATLGSAFHLDYPSYDILLCIASQSDPAIPLVERLIQANPQVQARLLVGDDRISINPKLNNLVKGWEATRSDWVVMADSNVQMPPDAIQRLFARWIPGTGLVCSPPVGAAPGTLASELECAFLNTFQARWQIAADAIGLGFAQGKTMLFERAVLERAGGIRALAAEAAEDAAATKILRRQGLRVRVVLKPFPQPLGRRSLADVWNRQLRWMRLRRASFVLFFVPEILAGGFLPMTAAALLAVAGAIPTAALIAFVAIWYGTEALLARICGWPLSWRTPFMLAFRDMMLPCLWVVAWSGSDFVWQGHPMSVKQPLRAAPELQLARE